MPEVTLLAGGRSKLELLASRPTTLLPCYQDGLLWDLILGSYHVPPYVVHSPEADLFGLDQHLGDMGVRTVL